MHSSQRLADIHDIQQNLYRYARGVDRRDWAQVRASYHPDAWDNHGSYKGDIDGFIASLEKRHANISRSMHQVSNILIEFIDEDSALVESAFSCHQRVHDPVRPDASVDNHSIGRYLDHVTRRDGHWRIAQRDVVFDFYFAAPANDSPRLSSDITLSTRDTSDLLYVRRLEFGLTLHTDEHAPDSPVRGNHTRHRDDAG